MALSKPAGRQHIHTRLIKCKGFKRDDDLWDIEATITDTKTYSFDNHDRGGISSGEPIHHMKVRITIDDQMTVKKAEADTIHSPYSICEQGVSPVSGIQGLKIGTGWRRALGKVLGRTKGCTHIRDLIMGPLAQTAYQTIIPMRRRNKTGERSKEKPAVIGTCVAWDETGPIVQRYWPQHYSHSRK